MSIMTEPTTTVTVEGPSLAPNMAYIDFNCPPWCISKHGDEGSLAHDSAADELLGESGEDLASAWISREADDSDGPLITYGPPKIGVGVTESELTADQVRAIAAFLVAAADRCDEEARRGGESP